MSKLYLMTTIINRNLSKKYSNFFDEEDLKVMFITLGSGTASDDVLDYLEIGRAHV